MTIYIVCQQSAGQNPVKVAAFKDKAAAADDISNRLQKAPFGVMFWLEAVEMGPVAA